MDKPQGKPQAAEQPVSFEEALSRLEAIIERIEGGQVGLEQAIAEYERGVALIRRCKDILQKAEQRVDELSRQAAGLDRQDLPRGGSAEMER